MSMQTSSLFIPAQTLLHRLHPVVKVLSLVLMFVPALAFNHPAWVGGVLALGIMCLLVAGGLHNLRRLAAFLIVLFILSSVLWALFMVDLNPEEIHALLVIGPLTVSSESALYGLAMGCRITSFLIFGLAFVTSTRPEEFTFALRRFHLPSSVSLALSLSFRLLPSFLATVQTVKDAQQARGLELNRGGLLTRLRRYLSLAAPVFGYALRQADNLSRALEARGLMTAGRSTELRSFPVTWVDVSVIAGVVALAAGSLALRLAGYGELLPRI
jgi:energy-coupling factor transport system permease protein